MCFSSRYSTAKFNYYNYENLKTKKSPQNELRAQINLI